MAFSRVGDGRRVGRDGAARMSSHQRSAKPAYSSLSHVFSVVGVQAARGSAAHRPLRRRAAEPGCP